MTTKVLIVDDSPLIRKIFSEQLGRDSEIQVVGTAQDPFVARDLIIEQDPDVITLDLEMPRMDGLTFLRKLMAYHPMPVIIVSSLTPAGGALALEALSLGAVEVMCKPGTSYALGDMTLELIEQVKRAAEVAFRVGSAAPAPQRTTPVQVGHQFRRAVLTLGASTGGTVAIERVLLRLPRETPGTLVTQHMPEVFTRAFAERLDRLCSMEVKEAEDGDEVGAGRVLIAPGGRHLLLRRSNDRLYVTVKHGPRVNHHRPSVDVMFRSVSRAVGASAVGVLLTGMGTDGARGLRDLRASGAATIAQDEASCVVFGMPKAALDLDAVDSMVSLDRIPEAILQHL